MVQAVDGEQQGVDLLEVNDREGRDDTKKFNEWNDLRPRTTGQKPIGL